MPIDFRKHLNPETIRRMDKFDADKRKHEAMDDTELYQCFLYYRDQASPPDRFVPVKPGQGTYDSVLNHVVIPELARRFAAKLVDQKRCHYLCRDEVVPGETSRPQHHRLCTHKELEI